MGENSANFGYKKRTTSTAMLIVQGNTRATQITLYYLYYTKNRGQSK